jgi:hypothetical protein
MTAGDDPVAAAVTQFLKTGPSKERFLEYLMVDLCEQFPKSCSKYVFLGALLSDLDKTAQLAWVVDFVNRRIEAAGFGNHPEDYYWRPIVEGALTFSDVTDGTANLVDIVSANDSLDRRQARQAAAARLSKAQRRNKRGPGRPRLFDPAREDPDYLLLKMMLWHGAKPLQPYRLAREIVEDRNQEGQRLRGDPHTNAIRLGKNSTLY